MLLSESFNITLALLSRSKRLRLARWFISSHTYLFYLEGFTFKDNNLLTSYSILVCLSGYKWRKSPHKVEAYWKTLSLLENPRKPINKTLGVLFYIQKKDIKFILHKERIKRVKILTLWSSIILKFEELNFQFMCRYYYRTLVISKCFGDTDLEDNSNLEINLHQHGGIFICDLIVYARFLYVIELEKLFLY